MKFHLCALILAAAPLVHAADMSLARTGLVAPDTLLRHQTELGITPDQAERLRRLVDEAQQQSQGLEAAVKEQQQVFEKAIQNPEAKADAGRDQLRKLLDAEAALKQLQLHTLLGIRAELTPEQRAQALKLGAAEAEQREPLEARLKEKGQKLRNAFESAAVELSETLKGRASEIAKLAGQGRLAEAEQALDALAKDAGLDEPVQTEAIDFDKYETGATDVPALQDRYAAVKDRARQVIHLPTLKKLLQGRDELEKAKAAEDDNRVARILTWAEGVLAKK